MIGRSSLETFGLSLIYRRNKFGPNMDLWWSPHSIFKHAVLSREIIIRVCNFSSENVFKHSFYLVVECSALRRSFSLLRPKWRGMLETMCRCGERVEFGLLPPLPPQCEPWLSTPNHCSLQVCLMSHAVLAMLLCEWQALCADVAILPWLGAHRARTHTPGSRSSGGVVTVVDIPPALTTYTSQPYMLLPALLQSPDLADKLLCMAGAHGLLAFRGPC